MPISAEVLGDQGGLRAGLLPVLVDEVAGRLAACSALPRLVATSHIDVQTMAPARGQALLAEAVLLRRGRGSITVCTTLFERELAPDADGLAENGQLPALGRSLATFSTIASSVDESTRAALELRGPAPVPGGAGLAEPFLTTIGLQPCDPYAGVFELPLSPYVANHVRALRGGMFGVLVETSAESACRAATGEAVVVLDLSIPYLAMGRKGPFRTRARIIRATPEHAVAEVDVIDTGYGDRLMTRATAVACVTTRPRVSARSGTGVASRLRADDRPTRPSKAISWISSPSSPIPRRTRIRTAGTPLRRRCAERIRWPGSKSKASIRFGR